MKMKVIKKYKQEEENGRGVGGHGVYLSPWIHQEYTFRPRSACRTPAESGQECLTRGKNIQNHAKLHKTEELGGETGVLLRQDMP